MAFLTEEEYLENSNAFMGYCTECKDFTEDEVEPDAEGYDCPDCENQTVLGTEQALLMGLIEVRP